MAGKRWIAREDLSLIVKVAMDIYHRADENTWQGSLDEAIDMVGEANARIEANNTEYTKRHKA